ncbi:hypothetical protein HPB49_001076 [Dermacentor silvarum]|uniref:Uncharacterized protein n=1 Tax=Dermacentor silvarum TaxID=543639 RepID=A0ACB8CUG3_DERSI|nr:receptor expression-enhancing protein 4 [Dermacentor silvarum]KAH7952787.1 hypothetical protein HPB49_001076 [Dermacentor silvarum]
MRMCSCRKIVLALGLVGPLYFSFKSLEAANEERALVWLKYWTGLGVYLAVDSVLALLFCGPISGLIECIGMAVLIWMQIQAPQIFYDSFVGPQLLKWEPEIDYLFKNIVAKR